MGCSAVLLLCNITKTALLHQSAMPALQHHRGLLCSVTSQRAACYINLLCHIIEGCYALPALQHHRGLLCSACFATSQRAALLCLFCNITEGCSATSIYAACSATSQRATLLHQSALPALQHHRGLLCSATL